MRTITSFHRYTGYLNFINGPIRFVLLLIRVVYSFDYLPNCDLKNVIKYCTTERNGDKLFWSIKCPGEILN